MCAQTAGAAAHQDIDIDITSVARAARWVLRGYQLIVFFGTPLFLLTLVLALWGALRDDPATAVVSLGIYGIIAGPAWYYKGKYSARGWLVFAVLAFLFLLILLIGMIAVLADEKPLEIEALVFFLLVSAVLAAALWAGAFLYLNRLPGYGMRLRNILSAVNQFRETRRGNFVLPPPRNPIRAYVFLSIGGLICLASLAVVPVVGALAAIGFPVAAWFIVRGRQHLTPDAEDLLKADDRPPVLLLRSFEDDPTEVTPKNLISYLQRSKYTLEEALAPELSGYGPFIAIGAPDEPLPRLGAARSYFTDDTWQQAIEDWIGFARMIVLVAGRTEWVEWEVKTILENQCLGKLLMVLPPEDMEARQGRWGRLCEHFTGTTWYSVLKSVDPEQILVLHFWPNHTLTIVRSRKNHQVDYELAVSVSVFGMLGLNAGEQRVLRRDTDRTPNS